MNSSLKIKVSVICILLNFIVASFLSLLKAPLYLDAIGTIIATIIFGFGRTSVLIGVISFILMTVTGIGPYHIYFVGTQIAISGVVYVLTKRNMLKTYPKQIISGVLIGVIAALVSAPVIVYLFGGIEGNGAGYITAFMVSMGNTIVESVLLKGIAVEPIDKTIQVVLAIFLIRKLPKNVVSMIDTKQFIRKINNV